MTCLIKIINFVYEDEKKKIKFRCDASRDLIDGLIRHELGIATNIDYSLVDLADDCAMDVSLLIDLADQSNVSIQPRPVKTKNTSGEIL
jgi:hypothetical protein